MKLPPKPCRNQGIGFILLLFVTAPSTIFANSLLIDGIKNGLKAHYSFDIDWTDGSGYGRNLTAYSATIKPNGRYGWDPDSGTIRYGGTADFTASTGARADYTTSSTLSNNVTAFSFASWIKINNFSRRYGNEWSYFIGGDIYNGLQVRVGVADYSNKDFWVLAWPHANGFPAFNGSNGNPDLAAGDWYHIAVTRDSTKNLTAFYFNGEEKYQFINGESAHLDLDYFFLGNYYYQQYSAGEMDDVRIYDRPLTAAEVRYLAAPLNEILFSIDSGVRPQGQVGYTTISGTLPVLKSGYGTLVLDAANTYTGPTSINQGTLLVTNSAALQATPITVQAGGTLSINTAGTMQAPSLTLTGSSQLILPTATRQVVNLGSLSIDQAAGARLDIGKGRIEIAPGGISEADLRADLLAGRGAANFTGSSGIVTSAPNPSSLMVPVIGYNISPSGAAIVAWSAFGDLNLDGSVDFDDVVQFVSAGRYDTGLPANWAQGDFDYNGVVDFDDIVAFTGSRLYDKGSYLPAPLAPSGMAAFSGESLGIAAVPEPSTWVVVVGGIARISWSAWRRRKAAA